MKKILLLILFFNLSAKAQITGIIKDSLTGKPIQFATIWVENEKIGANSQTDGTFSINAEKSKKISISVLGYKTKKATLVDNIEILMQPMVYELKEVAIVPRKNKTKYKLIDFSKSDVRKWQGSNSTPYVRARLITPDAQTKKHSFFKSITVNTLSRIDNAICELQFLEVTANGSPGTIINDEKIIFKVKDGKANTDINVFDYFVKMPENGVFIAFKWLIIEENKYVSRIYENPRNKNSKFKEFTNYAPLIGMIPSNELTSWTFWGGNWYEDKLNKISSTVTNNSSYLNKYDEIAMKITFTD